MTLRDVIANLDSYADELAIYASPRPCWRPRSPAAVLDESEPAPSDAAGLTFLLSVHDAKRVLREWREFRPGLRASLDELARAVIYFARHDVLQPLDETG